MFVPGSTCELSELLYILLHDLCTVKVESNLLNVITIVDLQREAGSTVPLACLRLLTKVYFSSYFIRILLDNASVISNIECPVSLHCPALLDSTLG